MNLTAQGLTVKLLLPIIIFVGLLVPLSAEAEKPRQLDWEHLVPIGGPIDDPTRELTADQAVELEMIASIRARRKLGMISDVDEDAEWGVELEAGFKKQGLDVEALMARYMEMQVEIRKRNRQIVPTLNGQLIRMPGYVLPLEFEGESIEEFLLVPFIGACIHVPAPPQNQMVYVQLNQSFAMKDLYEPVWITGRMKTEAVDKSLKVIDGDIKVSAGYVLDGIKIEPYTE